MSHIPTDIPMNPQEIAGSIDRLGTSGGLLSAGFRSDAQFLGRSHGSVAKLKVNAVCISRKTKFVRTHMYIHIMYIILCYTLYYIYIYVCVYVYLCVQNCGEWWVNHLFQWRSRANITIKKKLKHGKLKEIMNMVRQWIHMVGFNMSWSHEPPKNWF